MKSQNLEILSYLKSGKVITPKTADRKFNCMRLAARIYDLRGKGHHIADAWNKLNNGKQYKRYWLDTDKSIAITPPRGHRMPQTVEYYEKLAIADLNLIMQQKTQIERLTRKNNQLRQKINQQKGGSL